MTDAYCTVNGAPVVRGNIARPRIGVWHADLVVDAQDPAPFAGAVTIALGGALTLQGTAFRSGVHHDTVFIRCVGGAGGLGKQLAPKAYRGVPLRIPVQDVISGAGEALAPSSDPGILATALPFWNRTAGPAERALKALLAAAGSPAWRVLSDGTIWIGTEAWPEVSLTYDEIEFSPDAGKLEMACDVPAIDPGQTFVDDAKAKHRVSFVEHRISADAIRHVLLFEGESQGDRMKRAIDGYVRSLFPRIDYLAGYWAKVVGQNGDGSLELLPDDPRFDQWSGVPIRYGVPGITAKVSAGARALVEFAAGDPSRPMVTAWEPGTALELDLAGTTIKLNGSSLVVTGSAVAALGGSTPVAKEGSSLTGTAGPYALSGSVASGAGSANVKVP